MISSRSSGSSVSGSSGLEGRWSGPTISSGYTYATIGRVMEAHRYLGLALLLLVACSGAENQDVLGGSTASGGTSSGSSGGSSGSSGSSGTPQPIDTTNCTPEQERNDGREAANVI